MRNVIPSRATISHNDYKGRGDTVSQVVSLALRHVAENRRILTHDAEEEVSRLFWLSVSEQHGKHTARQQL